MFEKILKKEENIYYFRVLYFSIHRYEHGKFWPSLKSGSHTFTGEGKGRGYNINVPVNQVNHFNLCTETISGRIAGCKDIHCDISSDVLIVNL